MFNLSQNKRKANRNEDSILNLLDWKNNTLGNALSVKLWGNRQVYTLLSGVQIGTALLEAIWQHQNSQGISL